MEPIAERQNSQEELCDVTKTEASTDDTPRPSEDVEGSSKEDQHSLSPCGAETESQAFHLRAGPLRRDVASLEQRLQWEESRRDQEEEEVKEEVSRSQALLHTLVPLCEQKHQTMELVQRLQRALGLLPAAMMRMSTRSEGLGAMKEEKRISQEVAAMLQHVEGLSRVCSTEHTELSQLQQSLEEKEKPPPEKDDFSSPQAAGSPYYTLWGQGDAEIDLAGLNRRNTWRGAGWNATQPALQRLINSSAWMELNESSLITRYEDPDLSPAEKEEEDTNENLSRLTRLRGKLVAFAKAARTRDSGVLRMVRAFPAMVRDRSSWEWWTPLVLAVMLASLLALLGTLTFRPAVETDLWRSVTGRPGNR